MAYTQEQQQDGVTRRGALKGAALGAAMAGAAGLVAGARSHGTALAAQAAESGTGDSLTYADTIAWDAEYDVVVVGMGFAGMTAAMAAADEGATVLIVEKSKEGTAGGNSRLCGQGFAWAHGDSDGAYAYYKALSAGRSVPDDMIRTFADGVARTGDILAGYGFDESQYHDANISGICPEYPEFEGSEHFTQSYVHDTTGDSFIYKTLKERIAEQYAGKIDVWYESPAQHLVQEHQSGAIIGVRVSRDGGERVVHALNGVCMTCGGFEADRNMVEQYLGVMDYSVMGSFDNTGDGLRMCQEVGARMWHMSVYEGGFSLCGCGYAHAEDEIAPYSLEPKFNSSMDSGATILVGTWGKRFGNESYYPRHGHLDGGNGIWENPRFPQKIWAIWDQTQMDAINDEGVFNEDFRDTVITCPTIADIVSATGMHEDVITKTIEDFNSYAEAGEDPEFGRSADKMRAFDGTCYYVMPMKSLLLNTQGGAERNVNCEVIGQDGEPIPHLYSAGEFGGITSCMYQSGSNTAECYVFGPIAGRNAAAAKDDLPAYQTPTRVVATPSKAGDETDLQPEQE